MREGHQRWTSFCPHQQARQQDHSFCDGCDRYCVEHLQIRNGDEEELVWCDCCVRKKRSYITTQIYTLLLCSRSQVLQHAQTQQHNTIDMHTRTHTHTHTHTSAHTSHAVVGWVEIMNLPSPGRSKDVPPLWTIESTPSSSASRSCGHAWYTTGSESHRRPGRISLSRT